MNPQLMWEEIDSNHNMDYLIVDLEHPQDSYNWANFAKEIEEEAAIVWLEERSPIKYDAISIWESDSPEAILSWQGLNKHPVLPQAQAICRDLRFKDQKATVPPMSRWFEKIVKYVLSSFAHPNLYVRYPRRDKWQLVKASRQDTMLGNFDESTSEAMSAERVSSIIQSESDRAYLIVDQQEGEDLPLIFPEGYKGARLLEDCNHPHVFFGEIEEGALVDFSQGLQVETILDYRTVMPSKSKHPWVDRMLKSFKGSFSFSPTPAAMPDIYGEIAEWTWKNFDTPLLYRRDGYQPWERVENPRASLYRYDFDESLMLRIQKALV